MSATSTLEDQSPAEWKPGDVILGLYEVLSVLGRGGMGSVLRVRHRGWDTDLAVKCPHPEVIGQSRGAELFERECATWVNLGLHPHVVSCYYVRRLGGVPRVFAEYVSGGTLHASINRGPLYKGAESESIARILDFIIQIAWGLGHAHDCGLIHQDVKPANVLVTPEGMVKVTDFGLARAAQAASTAERGGGPQGTPVYFSPEHTSRAPMTAASDVWSFALLILEMFVGEVTWMSGQAAPAILDGYLELGAERPNIPPMPTPLVDLLSACFRINPADRPQSMDAFADLALTLYAETTGAAYPREKPQAQSSTLDQLNNRAVSLLDLGKRDEATALWAQALAASESHMQAFYNHALYQWRRGAITDITMLKHIKRLHEIHPKSWMPHYMLAQVHLERGDCESAAAILKNLEVREIQGHEVAQAALTAETNLEASRKLLKNFGKAGVVKALKLSWDGAVAVTGGGPSEGPGVVELWNVQDGALMNTFNGHAGQVRCVDFSADGMQAASGGKDGVVRLWPVAPVGEERTLRGHTKPVLAVLFSEDGRTVLSASVDGTIRIWDRESGRGLRVITAHEGGVSAMVHGVYNRTVVSAGRDGVARVWELETGNCLREFRGTNDAPYCIAVSGDRRLVAAGTAKGYIEVWDLASGNALGSRRIHSAPITALCLSKKGRYAVTGTQDATIRLWEARSGRCLHTFAGAAPISLSGDENTALSVSADGSLALWRIGFEMPYLPAPMLICRE